MVLTDRNTEEHWLILPSKWQAAQNNPKNINSAKSETYNPSPSRKIWRKKGNQAKRQERKQNEYQPSNEDKRGKKKQLLEGKAATTKKGKKKTLPVF